MHIHKGLPGRSEAGTSREWFSRTKLGKNAMAGPGAEGNSTAPGREGHEEEGQAPIIA